MSAYQPLATEAKIQSLWQQDKYATPKALTLAKSSKPNYVCLTAPINLAEKLQLGHCRSHVICDAMARYQRMQNKNVVYGLVWDTFGIQNHLAAKVANQDPNEWASNTAKTAQQLLSKLGISFAENHTIMLSQPDSYRWQQQLFTHLWKQKNIVNPDKKESIAYWDPGTKAYISLRHMVNGRGPESGMLVKVHKSHTYEISINPRIAEKLVTGLDKLNNWERSVSNMQRESIGRETGLTITFKVFDQTGKPWSDLDVFTSRPDTLMGTTFLAVGTKHELAVKACTTNEEVAAFCHEVDDPTYAYRKIAQEKQQEGIPLGLYALNPINGDHIPVWVANFVVAGYGTNSILGVPGHDQRNFNFAQRYNLPIRRIKVEPNGDPRALLKKPLTDKYALPCNCGDLQDYLSKHTNKLLAKLNKQQQANPSVDVATTPSWKDFWDQQINACLHEFLTKRNIKAQLTTVNRLRTWNISTNDYWGCPVPLIHCNDCGTVPVPDNQLPIKLPKYEVGKESLADYKNFVRCKCPNCNKQAKRDTDTFATLFDNSVQYVRVLHPTNTNLKSTASKHLPLPIDFYCCGIESANNHLTSVRLMHKLMQVAKVLPEKSSAEPVNHLLARGLVLNYGLPMSQAYANSIQPQGLLEDFGADTLRLFLGASVDPRHSLHWDNQKLFALQGCLSQTEFKQLKQQKLSDDQLQKVKSVLSVGELQRLTSGLLNQNELALLRANKLPKSKLSKVKKVLSKSELVSLQQGLLSNAQFKDLRNDKLNQTLNNQVSNLLADIEIQRLRYGLLAQHELLLLIQNRLPSQLANKVNAILPKSAIDEIRKLAPNPDKEGDIIKLQTKILDKFEQQVLDKQKQQHALLLTARKVLSEFELTSLQHGLLNKKRVRIMEKR